VNFRDKRKRDDYELHSIENINALPSIELDGLQSFSLHYFCRQMSVDSYEVLFLTLDEPTWLGRGASKSVTNKIENLASFLIFLYQDNKLFFLPLIKLNDFLQNTINQLSSVEAFEAKNAARSLYGVRHDLSSNISDFLKVCNLMVGQLDHDQIVLEAIGPLDNEFYQTLFDHLGENVKVLEVRLKNSPNFVKVAVKASAVWAFVSLILSTQYKYSIEEISAHVKEEQTQLSSTALLQNKAYKAIPDNINDLKSFKLSLGPLETDDSDIGFQMISIFSNGMTEKLQIGISAKRAVELHTIILGFTENKKNAKKKQKKK
jgi:hypothetical protein